MKDILDVIFTFPGLLLLAAVFIAAVVAAQHVDTWPLALCIGLMLPGGLVIVGIILLPFFVGLYGIFTDGKAFIQHILGIGAGSVVLGGLIMVGGFAIDRKHNNPKWPIVIGCFSPLLWLILAVYHISQNWSFFVRHLNDSLSAGWSFIKDFIFFIGAITISILVKEFLQKRKNK